MSHQTLYLDGVQITICKYYNERKKADQFFYNLSRPGFEHISKDYNDPLDARIGAAIQVPKFNKRTKSKIS